MAALTSVPALPLMMIGSNSIGSPGRYRPARVQPEQALRAQSPKHDGGRNTNKKQQQLQTGRIHSPNGSAARGVVRQIG